MAEQSPEMKEFQTISPEEVLMREPSVHNIARLSREQADIFAERMTHEGLIPRAGYVVRNAEFFYDRIQPSQLRDISSQAQEKALWAAESALRMVGEDTSKLDSLSTIRAGTSFIQRILHDGRYRGHSLDMPRERALIGYYQAAVEAFSYALTDLGEFPEGTEAKYFVGNLIGSFKD